MSEIPKFPRIFSDEKKNLEKTDEAASCWLRAWVRILVQVTIYRRFLIGRDGHLDQSEANDIS